MAVASAARMVLLSGSLLDSWWQVVSPFSKLNLAWASCPEIMHLLTPPMRSCLLGSQSCIPGGKLGVLRGQTNSALIYAEVMASSTLRPMGGAGDQVTPPLPFGLAAYKSTGSVEFMQGMMCWIVNVGTSFHIVIHGQLQPTFLQRSLLASAYRLDTGLVQNAPNASLNPELWMLSSCRRLVFDAVPYTMRP